MEGVYDENSDFIGKKTNRMEKNIKYIDCYSVKLKGPTSPRIVTSKQLSKHAWNAAHCTVNTFIHKHPNHLTVPAAWSKSF
jgi:hypothetical protein